MSESTTDIFLNHIDNIKDDIYHSSKKIIPGTNVMTWNNHFLVAESVYPNIESNLVQSVFNVRKSLNIFSHHIGQIWDDSCGSSKKIQQGTNFMKFSSYFLLALSVDPNIETGITQSVFNVLKYLNIFSVTLII